ncbi:MAG: DUF2254 domain-containing protein [Chthoniobacterales bacterium]|nr:MAG: DUF2254 domain-containing protein [Chthoniobacterales bacterium]
MKTFLSAMLERLRTSYWFIPSLLALGATALSFATVHADTLINAKWVRTTGWIWAGGPEGARNVLATIAGSTITVAGVVFSVTIVSLTLASSQFGPRLLRTFLNDRWTQIVLGVFVSTFLYCLLVLRTIRGTDAATFVPFLSVTVGLLFAVTSVAFLIFFVHHVSNAILADNLIARVATELRRGIDRLYPDEVGIGENSVAGGNEHDLPPHFEEEAQAISSKVSGYIQAIAIENLLAFATEENIVLRLSQRPGDFVAEGATLALLWPGEKSNDGMIAGVRRAFYFGNERTPTQDLEYSIDQLVEVAVRALSPGINDPFTAMTCIDWLGSALIRVAGRELPSGWRYDDERRLRIIAKTSDFAGMAAAAFNQIRQYGSKSVAVMLRLLETLAKVAPHLRRETDRGVLREHARKIRDDGCAQVKNQSDRAEIEERFAIAERGLRTGN